VLIWHLQTYYDYFTQNLYPPSSNRITLNTPLSTFPVLIQGGSILPIRQRVRRSSPLMWQDPFTFIVALSKDATASGQLYLDDGVGYGYEKGEYVWRELSFLNGVLRSTDMSAKASIAIAPYQEKNGWAQAIGHVKVEQLVVLGLKSEPKSVTVAGQRVQWSYEAGAASGGKQEGTASRLTIKKPGVGVVSGWEVVIA
jgi:alpha 1,3-glucosidase